jgi:hypothetical protein
VCANTQAAAIARAKASFAIRHTGGARGAINEARTALGLSWRYMEAFEAEAAALYAEPMDVEKVRSFAAELVKVDQAPSTAARTRRREQANGIVKLFVSSPTVQPIAGTRWAAYNAVAPICATSSRNFTSSGWPVWRGVVGTFSIGGSSRMPSPSCPSSL